MSFVAVSAGIGAVSLGTGLYKSIKEGNEASAINKSNARPTYQIPEEYQQNLRMAQQMAQVGTPQQQYNNQLNGIYRNQAGALGALSNSANPGAGLASIVRAGNDSLGKLNAQDALSRQQNQRLVLQQNNALAQQELAKQQYDKFDKYSENFNRAQALESASNANLNGALNSASSLAGGLASTYTPNMTSPNSPINGSTDWGPLAGNYGFGNPATQPNNWQTSSYNPVNVWSNQKWGY